MRIKEESIQELLNRVNILDVISDYVKLKKTGKNYVALCPFHKEKTPSFTVNPEKNMFYCFGCQVGGNAISFLMKKENYDFVEAVEALAQRFNISLEYERSSFVKKDSELDKLLEYSKIAARFFYDNLTKTDEGSNAIEYLKNRGITIDTVKQFSLGYALNSWDSLVSYIKKNNYDVEIFKKLGLIIESENGRYYDRFRGRIIFPIYSKIGQLIAFGGRLLIDDSTQPKYLNSPESRIYIKGKTLYGLFHSKEFIRKTNDIIIVEGYMDLLSLYQKGIKNVVATAGTALTLDQVSEITRLAENVYIVFDGDEAGQKAAVRAIDMFIQSESNFKIVILPEKEDPDSFISKYGKDKFEGVLKEGKNYIDFIHSLALKNQKLKDENSKVKVINSLLEMTAKVKDPVRREVFLSEISLKFNVSLASLNQSLTNILTKNSRFELRKEKLENEDILENRKLVDYENVSPAEKGLIKALFEGDESIRRLIFTHVQEDDLINPSIIQIFSIIKKEYEQGNEISEYIIINKLQENIGNILSNILFDRYRISDSWEETDYNDDKIKLEQFTKDCIKMIRLNKLERLLKEKQSLISNINDKNEFRSLIKQIETINKQILNIRSGNYQW